MTKPTQGPWTEQQGKGHIKIWASRPRFGATLIAEVRNENIDLSDSGQEEKANSRLISGAPTLLSTLQDMLVVYESLKNGESEWRCYDSHAEEAHELIAKITRETRVED